MSAIFFSAAIGPVPVAVILREGHVSELGITENPIETGAKITDHAYIEPKRVVLEFADTEAVATYAALVRFQESRQPFTVVTGLAAYPNMLIKAIDVDRDHETGRILRGTARLQEAILVSTAYTASEGDTTGGQGGKAGGKASTRAAPPSPERAGDGATRDRAAGTVQRGDSASRTVTGSESQSILSRVFGH